MRELGAHTPSAPRPGRIHSRGRGVHCQGPRCVQPASLQSILSAGLYTCLASRALPLTTHPLQPLHRRTSACPCSTSTTLACVPAAAPHQCLPEWSLGSRRPVVLALWPCSTAWRVLCTGSWPSADDSCLAAHAQTHTLKPPHEHDHHSYQTYTHTHTHTYTHVHAHERVCKSICRCKVGAWPC